MKRLIWTALAAALAGCGGGGGGGSARPNNNPPVPQNASPGGIWQGTLGSGEVVVGLVTETGEFHFLSESGVQYFGTVDTSGNNASGNFTGVTAFGTVFVDGSTFGTGTLTGTVDARSTFNGSTSFTTSGGMNVSDSISLTYDAVYERDSSLQTVAGNYLDVATGNVVNVNSNGEVFSQDATSGCVVNGTVSIIDSQFNAYRVEYTYSSCQGPFAALNGRTFRGLATLDNRVLPEQLIVGATYTAGSTGVSVMLFLDRT